jgi:ABC-type dipeptide/oligopeptide/nickel transport system permease subunit
MNLAPGKVAAALSFALLALLLLAALLADLVAANLLGFTFDEVHARDSLLPSGSISIPDTRRTYDGSAEAFALLDRNGDGTLAVSPPQESIPGELADGKRLARGAWREWKLQVQSPQERLAGVPVHRLMGRIDHADELDIDRDGQVDHREMLSSTAIFHLEKADLIAMDSDGDGQVVAAEFLGAPMARRHLLGTDSLGRDLAVRLLYGLRVTLLVALCATFIAFLMGAGLGLAAGFLGGRIDRTLLRLLEVLQAVPFIFVVILLTVATRDALVLKVETAQAQALAQAVVLFCALGAVQWFSLARYARGLGASLRNEEFVLALRGMGYSTPRIVVRHLLPNAFLPLLAFGTLLIPTLVLEEAFLSFLGFGVQPPFPSLGILLSDGVAMLDLAPTLMVAPAFALLALTWSLHVSARWLSERTGSGGRP